MMSSWLPPPSRPRPRLPPSPPPPPPPSVPLLLLMSHSKHVVESGHQQPEVQEDGTHSEHSKPEGECVSTRRKPRSERKSEEEERRLLASDWRAGRKGLHVLSAISVVKDRTNDPDHSHSFEQTLERRATTLTTCQYTCRGRHDGRHRASCPTGGGSGREEGGGGGEEERKGRRRRKEEGGTRRGKIGRRQEGKRRRSKIQFNQPGTGS
eukprot:765376-Hanusia_phi.AAC.9